MVQASPGGGKITLGYWNLRGATRGNVARYLLAYCGADWEEKTYMLESGEWQQAKDTVMDFANLPYVIDGDFKISETYAVHNYIAQKYCPELIGETPQEKARCHMLQRVGNDVFVANMMKCFAGTGDRTDRVAEFID